MSSASRHAPGAHPTPSQDEHVHPGLEIAVERKGSSASVTMRIAADELERARGREFSTLSKRVSMKGFRPGKVPRPMLEKSFGQEVERAVLEHFVQHAYQKAIDQEKLRPAAFPRIQLGENVPKPGQPFELTFELLLRPEVQLGQIEGLEIDGQTTEVTEPEIDRMLAELRRSNSRLEPAGEEGLEAEGMAVATLDFHRPGSETSSLTREGLRLTPKNAPAGIDARSYEEALTGARVGEQRSLEMEFPANFPVEEARGQKGTVRITLKEVFRVVPPADADVFKAFEVGDEAGLREAVRGRMRQGKQESEEQRIENELLERLIEAHPMELPDQLIEDQVQGHQQELREALEKQGLSADEARTRAEGEKEKGRLQAIKALKAVYLIEEIARAKELRVNEQDLSEELASIGQRNGTPVAEVAKYYRENGLLRQLGLELLERKVRRYLRASAAVSAPPA